MAGQIHRQKKNRDFVTIDTHCLRNPSLKWDAKGLHSYLMQLPDEWKVNISDLQTRSKTGRDGTQAAMDALIETGYVHRERKHGEGGKFEGYDYHLFERPEHTVNWLAVNGKSVNGFTVNGKSDTNKYYTPTELSKNEERGENEKNSLPAVESSTLEAKKNVEGNLPGDGPATLVELRDPEHPDIPVFDVIPAPATIPPVHRIELGDRPTAETPVQLEAALREFYTAWPNEWSIGILEYGKGSRYDKDRQKEIIKDFCCWAIEKNQQRNTYRELNARLQGWFRNEQHSTWKQAKSGPNGSHEKPVYERPKNAIY